MLNEYCQFSWGKVHDLLCFWIVLLVHNVVVLYNCMNCMKIIFEEVNEINMPRSLLKSKN